VLNWTPGNHAGDGSGCLRLVDLHQNRTILLTHDQLARRPAYAALKSLEPDCLVADLDRMMTVEKSIVATWTRTPGYVDDADGRAFAQALARKRVRVAFPDDFSELVDKLQRRLEDKHGGNSIEGRGLRALPEIRVRAVPA
jgi:hypothetical protein